LFSLKPKPEPLLNGRELYLLVIGLDKIIDEALDDILDSKKRININDDDIDTVAECRTLQKKLRAQMDKGSTNDADSLPR
jgi:hypothetical protein